MRKKMGSAHGMISERELIQTEIRERWGEEAIREARVRLCSECKEFGCFLLPLTLRGEDCPYFRPKEGGE